VTYYIQTYDVADEPGRDGEWTTIATGLTLWGLKRAIQDAYSRGYSEVSIYVSQEP
jgi:hypothetical protein